MDTHSTGPLYSTIKVTPPQPHSHHHTFTYNNQSPDTSFIFHSIPSTTPSSTPSSQSLPTFFHALLSTSAQHPPIVNSALSLPAALLPQLQSHCLTHFPNLPLFLLYQLSLTLPLPLLHKQCLSELTNQNYQQLNYMKYDLVKCSLKAFRQLLEEYEGHVVGLEVQGLRQGDLRAVIGDYCVAAGVGEKEAKEMMDRYVKNRGNTLAVGKQGTETRRSMINMRKGSTDQSLSPIALKSVNTLGSKTPDLSSNNSSKSSDCQPKSKISFNRSQTVISYPNIITNAPSHLHQLTLCAVHSTPTSWHHSTQQIKHQLEQYTYKQAQLHQQIKQIRLKIATNQNGKFIDEGLAKLEGRIKEMERQFALQKEKIEKLNRSAKEMQGVGWSKRDWDYRVGM